MRVASLGSLVLLSAWLPISCAPSSEVADAGVPNPQESYSYPGCEDAGSIYCPNLNVFACAMQSIRGKHDACQSAADCMTLTLDNCVGYFAGCAPAAVSKLRESAFREESGIEMARYCDGAQCRLAGSCLVMYELKLVDCRNGHCVALKDDGGT